MQLFLKDAKRLGWKLHLPIAKVPTYIPAKYLFSLLVILREMCFSRSERIYTNFDIATNENQMTGGCDHGKSVTLFISHFRKIQQTCVAITKIVLSEQHCASPAFKPRGKPREGFS